MPAQRKYPDELRERAVKMVLEIRQRDGKGHGEQARVGRQLGVHPEALRGWVKQAEIDNGTRPGTTSEDQRRIAELEREVRELRRANEILKAASACDRGDRNQIQFWASQIWLRPAPAADGCSFRAFAQRMYREPVLSACPMPASRWQWPVSA
jgi:transposase